MWWYRNPWREMERLRSEFDSLLGQAERASLSASFPLVNIYESADALLVQAELPGVAQQDVQLSFQDGSLVIKGRRELAAGLREMQAIRRERSLGEFEKSIAIPIKVKSEQVEARFQSGMLTISLPKAEEAKPKSITIRGQ